MLTPSNGSTYWPPQGDYEKAASAKFTIQIVAQNLNPSQAATIVASLTSTSFAQTIQSETEIFFYFE